MAQLEKVSFDKKKGVYGIIKLVNIHSIREGLKHDSHRLNR